MSRCAWRFLWCLVGAGLTLLATNRALAADTGHEALSELSQLRWTHRIVLVSDSATTTATLATLRANSDAIRERDLLWFLVSDAILETNYDGALANRFGASVRDVLAADAVVLIGKDGGVKLRTKALDLAAIFVRIDAMPMRRRELERPR